MEELSYKCDRNKQWGDDFDNLVNDDEESKNND